MCSLRSRSSDILYVSRLVYDTARAIRLDDLTNETDDPDGFVAPRAFQCVHETAT